MNVGFGWKHWYGNNGGDGTIGMVTVGINNWGWNNWYGNNWYGNNWGIKFPTTQNNSNYSNNPSREVLPIPIP
jgi:hypothetical protein